MNFLLLSIVIALVDCLVWQKVDIPAGPSPRKLCAFGFDKSRNFLVIFGGVTNKSLSEGDLNVLSDTWVLDVSLRRWYEVTTFIGPSGRYGSVYGFYKDNFYVTMGCNLDRCFGDTWVFNTGLFVWRKLNIESGIAPAPRFSAVGGIDEESGMMILFGGLSGSQSGTFLSDTYFLDLSHKRWFRAEERQSTYDPSVSHPRSSSASVMINPTTMLFFGGCIKHGSCPSGDTWTLNVQNQRWTQLPNCPSARSYGSLSVYDIQNDRNKYLVLYGGTATETLQILGSRQINANQISIFNLSSVEWFVETVSDPVPLMRHSAGFVHGAGQAYLFGGQTDEGVYLNDMWTLSGPLADSTPSTLKCSPDRFTLVALHGLFMFLSFGCVVQWGGMLAQYATTAYEPRFNWRYLHKALQVIGCVLSVAGMVTGFMMVKTGRHLKSVHSVLGLVLLITQFVMPLIVVIAQTCCKRTYSTMRFHYWLGIALMVLCYVNLSLGAFLAQSLTGIWLSWFVYVFVMLITFCVVQTTNCCNVLT